MSSVMLHPQTNKAGLWYQSQAAEQSKNVATGKGVLHTLLVANSNAAARFVWVFDSATASGTVLAGPFSVPAAGSVAIPILFGIPFSTGLTVATSSTQATYTAGAADMLVTVGYAKQAGL